MLKLKRCLGSGFQLHQFRPLILYSTLSPTPSADVPAISNPLMLQFLVDSVGFAEDEAVSIAAKGNVSHRFKSALKSQLVVDFFKSSGFHDTHIRKLIAADPGVLRSDVDKTLTPKIRVFKELGFYGSHLGFILSRNPFVFRRSFNAHILPTLEVLKSLLGCSNEQLVSIMLNRRSQLLLPTKSYLKYLPPNIRFLQSCGVPTGKLNWIMVQNPLILTQRTELLGKLVKRVEEKLGVPQTSGMFVHAVVVLNNKSDSSIKRFRKLFRGFGWAESEISKLIQIFPTCLTLSEDLLRAKLKYLMQDLGFGCDYLATRPALLSYSVKKRIVPRAAVMEALKANDLLKNGASLYAFVALAESKFMRRHMLPVRDKLPEIYDYYIQTRDGSPPKT